MNQAHDPEDESVDDALDRMKSSLLHQFDIGGLLARSPTAHKWKATFRSLLLREAVFWRFEDLLRQSHVLHKQDCSLGALILLRSGLETLATLIYLNQLMENVLSGSLDFHAFSDKTAVLLLGSRNDSTDHSALNINTVLAKCAKRYDFIQDLYGKLSECAHPNHEGLILGYSRADRENMIENFSNHWVQMYSGTHEKWMLLLVDMFQYEYNDVWIDCFSRLETWLVENEAALEANKTVSGGSPLKT